MKLFMRLFLIPMKKSKPISFKFRFPEITEEVIVPTGMMVEVINRSTVIHPGNSIWYGESRIGKTTTARFMVRSINEAYNPQNPLAYRAVHYEVGEIASWTGNEQKKGIKSLYYATLGRIDEGVYRHDPPEGLARQLVHGLSRKNIQLVLVDEAGLLSFDALRGMILVGDTAENMNYPLSFIFIGMDDLPTKVRGAPEVENRIQEWCYFEAYSLKETAGLLAQMHPHFAQLDFDNLAHYEQFECMYEMFGGFPGLIVNFLKKLDYYQRDEPDEINVKYLRTIQLRTLMDKKQCINKSLENYRGKPPKDSRQGVSRSKSQNEPDGQNNEKQKNEKTSQKKPGRSKKSKVSA